MPDDPPTLAFFYQNWGEFMALVQRALTPLTAEQLQLRVAPHERSVGAIAAHIVAGRARWFHDLMGEGGDALAAYDSWGERAAPPLTAADLVAGLAASWQIMAACLVRWTPTDMAHPLPHTWQGQHYDPPRRWVVWHVLEHDLLHAGEISLTLGMHGLPAPRP